MSTSVKIGLGFLGLIAVMFFIGMVNVFYTSTVGKAQQNAETGVYYSSQAYIDGKKTDLDNYQVQYLQAKDADEKAAIKLIILNDIKNLDDKYLSSNELDFIQTIRK